MKKILLAFLAAISFNVSANVASFEAGLDGFRFLNGTRYTYAQEATKNALGGNFFVASTLGNGVGIYRTDGALFTLEGIDVHSRAGIRENASFHFVIDGKYNEFGTTAKNDFVKHVANAGEVSFVQIAYNKPISYLAIAFETKNDWKYFGMDNIRYSVASPSPIPEPQTWAMMLAGILAVTFLNKRRQKSS
jgi:hypothetical protein